LREQAEVPVEPGEDAPAKAEGLREQAKLPASATGVKTRPPRPRVCASRPRSRLGHRGEVAPTEVEGRPHVRQRAGTAPRSFATPDLTPTCRVHHRDRVFLTAGGSGQ